MKERSLFRTVTVLVLVVVVGGFAGMTQGQAEHQAVSPEEWGEAFIAVTHAADGTLLEHQAERPIDQQRELVTALIDYLEDAKGRVKPETARGYFDISAYIMVRQAQTSIHLPEWVFVDVVARRLQEKGEEADHDLLEAVLMGADAFRIDLDLPKLFHHYIEIEDYLRKTEVSPHELPRPLILWMMERDQ